jgi:hypothetical protein
MKYLRFFFFGMFALSTLWLAALLGYARLELINPLNDQKAELQTNLADANLEIEKRIEQNSELRQQNEKLYDEINTTIDELTDYEQKITDSLDWFRDNQTIDGHPTYNRVKKDLQEYCVSIEGTTCEIKLTCLSFVNSNLYGLEYKEDTETSAKEDFLQTIDSIKDNEGGDCEDFSVLAAAELRSLQNYCTTNGATTIRYQAYENAIGQTHTVEYSGDYYYPDAKDYNIPYAYHYFYPICGNFPASFDLNAPAGAEIIGHCLLAFSARDLNPDDANSAYEFLRDALLIEPQDGAFVSDLATNDNVEVLKDDYPKKDFFLYMIITQNDLLDFDTFGDTYRWYGYNDFLKRIAELKTELEAM